MNINDIRAIPKPMLARGANVSIATIDRALGQLEAKGTLQRSKSPTGREVLTPKESQLVLDQICGRD